MPPFEYATGDSMLRNKCKTCRQNKCRKNLRGPKSCWTVTTAYQQNL